MNITSMVPSLYHSNGSTQTAPTSTTTTSPNQAANNAEQTFLSLLVTELKSQDPTQPMDPTTMVGQMLSMNQLNELIAINQTLQNSSGAPPTSGAAIPVTQSPISNLKGAN